jgi:hypothetical protein
MKILFVTFGLLVSLLLQIGCAVQKPPVEELERVTREYLAKVTNPPKVRGISLQPHPNNIYLVTVDGESSDGKPIANFLIGQLYQSDGKSYWQVADATPYRLKTLGIKKAKDDDDDK